MLRVFGDEIFMFYITSQLVHTHWPPLSSTDYFTVKKCSMTRVTAGWASAMSGID